MANQLLRRFALVAVLVAGAPLLGQEKPDRRPTLTVDEPREGAIVPTEGLIVRGRVSRADVPGIEFFILRVTEDDRQYFEGIVTLRVDDDGRFGTNITLLERGWPPGKLRVLVRIIGMEQIAQQRDLTVAPKDEAREPLEFRPSPSSGVRINLDDRRPVTTVPRAHKFIVTGTVSGTKVTQRPREGSVSAHLVFVRPDENGREKRFGSVWVPLLRDGENWWFEAEAHAPKDDGRYVMRLEENPDRPLIDREFNITVIPPIPPAASLPAAPVVAER